MERAMFVGLLDTDEDDIANDDVRVIVLADVDANLVESGSVVMVVSVEVVERELPSKIGRNLIFMDDSKRREGEKERPREFSVYSNNVSTPTPARRRRRCVDGAVRWPVRPDRKARR